MGLRRSNCSHGAARRGSLPEWTPPPRRRSSCLRWWNRHCRKAWFAGGSASGHARWIGPRAEAIRYALSRWEGLTRFLDDGRIEIDSNVVERAIRPIALNRKNALFAGSDGGGEHWAVIASLIETCKLVGIEPHAYLADVITKIVNGHPNSQIDDLLPWAYPVAPAFRDVA
jgi:hypothetical protein